MSVRSHIKTPGVHSIPGEPFRAHVESRTSSKVRHLVDLESYDWNGECSCQDFEFRCRPLLRRGAFPAQNLQCWHTNRARFYIFREMGLAVAKEYYKRVEQREGPGRAAPDQAEVRREVSEFKKEQAINNGRKVKTYYLK